jgi:hypothetical protein
MTLFALAYDQRATHHDYSKLYQLLKSWNASPLLNSVWLVEINGEASAVRDRVRAHMHMGDAVAVIQLSCRQLGDNSLPARRRELAKGSLSLVAGATQRLASCRPMHREPERGRGVNGAGRPIMLGDEHAYVRRWDNENQRDCSYQQRRS